MFTGDMMICVENMKGLTDLLELLGDCGKAAGRRDWGQTSTAFLHTSREQVGFEIKNMILFILASPKIKYLDIYLIK